MGVGVKIFGLWCLIFVYMIIMRKSTTKGTSTTDKYYGNTIAIIGWTAAHPIYLQGNFDIGESKIVAFSVSNPLSFRSLSLHMFFPIISPVSQMTNGSKAIKYKTYSHLIRIAKLMPFGETRIIWIETNTQKVVLFCEIMPQFLACTVFAYLSVSSL